MSDQASVQRPRPARPYAVTNAAVSLGFVMLLAYLAVSSYVMNASIQTMIQASNWVDETSTTVASFEALYAGLTEAESAQRTFVLLGQENYAGEFDRACEKAIGSLERARRFTLHRPTQEERHRELAPMVNAKVELMRMVVVRRRVEGADAATKIIAQGEGREMMLGIRRILNAMITDERSLLDARKNFAEASRNRFRFVFWGAMAIAAALTAAFYGLVLRHTRLMRAASETEQRHTLELERRVQERTDQLRIANEELEAFSYSVAHDLRGPLRSISAGAMMLAEDAGPRLSAEDRKVVAGIETQVRRMGALMDDLLNLGRISRGDLKREPVDLTRLATMSIEELRNRNPRPDLTIEIQENVVADVDPAMASVLLDNLIRNAWKYSERVPNARIKFGYELRNGRGVYFVSDTGIGFDMEYATRIFRPFERLHRTDEYEGSGIGLAICKVIVEKHGGAIWAESSPGIGATFSFTLREDDSARV